MSEKSINRLYNKLIKIKTKIKIKPSETKSGNSNSPFVIFEYKTFISGCLKGCFPQIITYSKIPKLQISTSGPIYLIPFFEKKKFFFF